MKIPGVFLVEIERLILSFIQKCKGPSFQSYEASKMLSYLQAKKLVWYSFIVSIEDIRLLGEK